MPMFEQLEISTNFIATIMDYDVITRDAKVLKVGGFNTKFLIPSPNSVPNFSFILFFPGLGDFLANSPLLKAQSQPIFL